MTKVKYSITIHTGRTNSLIFSKDDLKYINQDHRLLGVLKKARDIRCSSLISHNLLQTVETTIASYAQPPIKHNEQVLSIIACKYCYFMRNKMFHGQEADFTFCFTNHTEDDDITDFLNEILESLLFDLICDFDNI